MQRRTFVAGAAASLAVPTLRAQGSNLPAGPVRIIVGFAPGGGTDILARVIGQKLGDLWKTQVIVENKAGASGTIAADYVSKQPGDGNTLLMAHINSQAITPALQKLGYNSETDFQPIVLVGVTPNLLICNEQQPAKTVKDLVELCRKKPGSVSFGSAGTGSAQHLALEMFMLAAKVKAIHVPYKGSGPMLTDLIGGQINYSFDTMTAATPHVKSGKAIAIAQTRLKRAGAYPNVPTMAESGFPGFEATTWYGLVGPAKMPTAMAKRMNEDINKVMLMPDVVEKLQASGAEDGGGSTEKFAEFTQVEIKKWAKIIKDGGVKADA
ncbi:MAG TPA: tripartite tricarboxylate transporter substrate binding protein [Ramlibacter sp.]|jgi:tripartite-type tricarboxylate transporter receptor subunit TctC|uniref:Bug family tripartite tricarboxylate transporter substrate binding protein n=1 Tax=Ramlibacter sp. TaxID=1917967 RepID=UPI002D54F00F|nr:tripartite tricarboxylate transporter substrate binding protein [Ramlibacter sp.]HZY18048.1 tripartite tricarboxylate transporter substrate binding protein [Ramlibacter sp.]